MTNKEFRKHVLDQVNPGPFKPIAHYNPDDDSLEVLLSNENYRTKLTEPHFTVYYRRDTGEIIGGRITKVSRFIKDIMKNHPDLRVEVHSSKVKVVHIFKAIRELSQAEKEGKPLEWNAYKTLEEAAEKLHLQVEMPKEFVGCG